MRFPLPPMRHPRHPLVRALSLLIGLAVIGVLLVFGLVVAGVLLVGGVVLLAIRRWKQNSPRVSTQRASGHQPEVLEGEFVVVPHNRPVTH
jgi:uncharacterized protein (DUF58 family)